MRYFYCIIVCIFAADLVKGTTADAPAINKWSKSGSIIYYDTTYQFGATLRLLEKAASTDGKVVVRMESVWGRAKVNVGAASGGLSYASFTAAQQEKEIPENVVCRVTMTATPEDRQIELDDTWYAWTKFNGPKKVRVKLPAYDEPVTWKIVEGGSPGSPGKTLATVKLKAGESRTMEFTIKSGLDVYVFATTQDGVTSYAGTVPQGEMTSLQQATTQPINEVEPGGENIPDTVKGSGSSGSTVNNNQFTTLTTTAGDTDGARDQTLAKVGNAIAGQVSSTGSAIVDAVRNGDAEIVEAIKGIQSGGSGGETTVNVDTSALEGKVDAVKGSVDVIAGLMKGGENFNAGSKLGEASALAAAAGKFEGPQPVGSGSISGVSESAPMSLGTVKVGDQEIDFGFGLLTSGPFSEADSVLRSGRTVVLWALVIWFLTSCGAVLDRYIIGLGSVDSGSAGATGPENIVPGIAQAKAWGSAGIVVAALVTAAGAMVGIVDAWASSQGLGVADILSGFNMSTLGSAIGLLDRYLPVAAMAQLAVLRASFSYLVAPIYMTALTVVKFSKA